MNKTEREDLLGFTSLKKNKIPSWVKTTRNILVFTIILIAIVLTITPWLQTSHGTGIVSAFDPNDRIQNINSPVKGRINTWLVNDGVFVKKGDPVVEIVDNDPNYKVRLEMERDAILQSYNASKTAAQTALSYYKREKKLLNEGLSSKDKMEKARITYQKLLSSEASAAVKLAQAEVKLSRQETQLVRAPRDGRILRILKGSGSVFVKEGENLVTFVPSTQQQAVEVYIDGNDLPLVQKGRKARLQFEGWPAIQFSGWPAIAVGTFAGQVAQVDPSASKNGKFRVLIVPIKGEEWPDNKYLRQGVRVHAWITLNTVKLGYELWRRLNGFPPFLEQPADDDEDKDKKSDK